MLRRWLSSLNVRPHSWSRWTVDAKLTRMETMFGPVCRLQTRHCVTCGFTQEAIVGLSNDEPECADSLDKVAISQ